MENGERAKSAKFLKSVQDEERRTTMKNLGGAVEGTTLSV